MKIEQKLPLVNEILDAYRIDLGSLYRAYQNHVLRMLNFCFALRELAADPCNEDECQKLIIAGCFHDLGIWTDGTLAYLEPSIALVEKYLAEIGRTEWSDEIGRIIDQHHKIRRVRSDSSPLVELFRGADLIDVSMGLQRFGLPRSFVNQVSREFPNVGFHKLCSD